MRAYDVFLEIRIKKQSKNSLYSRKILSIFTAFHILAVNQVNT